MANYIIGGIEGMYNRQYIAIDLKSFYASVECVERGLDPMTTNLVVADKERTEKTICLAASPSLKAYGISGRARLFEVIQQVEKINYARQRKAPNRQFVGKSCNDVELKANRSLKLSYIAAPPRMALYIEYSTRIYNIYKSFIAPEDIHVYSIDEVFIDVTNYLKAYGLTARKLAAKIIKEVLKQTGITATAGIGTNLYLCKVAMDIVAKHIQPDADGVRIAELHEMSYRQLLWSHTPITDFWRVGHGYANKLENYGIYTMGDVARCSITNEALLYKLFGINAELLIDHAWGWEPCTISDIKAYEPRVKSISSGQVLQKPYTYEKGKLIVREMADLLALDLVEKELVTNQVVLTVGYDIENLTNPEISSGYHGEITIDHYGRKVPESVHGSMNMDKHNSSAKLITKALIELYENIVNKNLLIRRVDIGANNVVNEKDKLEKPEQLNLFTNFTEALEETAEEQAALEKERKIQETVLSVHEKYGKNALIKGMNIEAGATTVERNNQIGGHKK